MAENDQNYAKTLEAQHDSIPIGTSTMAQHPLVRVAIVNMDPDEEMQRSCRVHQVDRDVSFSVSLDSFLVKQLVSKVWPEASLVEAFPRACRREVFHRAHCWTEIQQLWIGV